MMYRSPPPPDIEVYLCGSALALLTLYSCSTTPRCDHTGNTVGKSSEKGSQDESGVEAGPLLGEVTTGGALLFRREMGLPQSVWNPARCGELEMNVVEQ